MLIYMDDRESRNTHYYFSLLSLDHNVIARRQTADYLIPDLGYAIERKTMPDFISSLNEGRLFSQLDELHQLAPHVFLCLDDDPNQFTIPANVWFATIASIELHHGARFVITYGCLDTWIHYHILKFSSGGKPIDPIRSHSSRTTTPQDEINHVLLALPGVGYERIKSLQGQKLIPAIQAARKWIRKDFLPLVE